jgi:LemA protein
MLIIFQANGLRDVEFLLDQSNPLAMISGRYQSGEVRKRYTINQQSRLRLARDNVIAAVFVAPSLGVNRVVVFLRNSFWSCGMVWIVSAILLFIFIASICIYNSLVRLRNQVGTAWSDIDVQLLRRHELVPRMVEVVKAYAAHENALLEHMTSLRAKALTTRSPARLAGLETQLEQSLTRVIALQEGYPELKASDNFSQLQRDLVDLEDQLQYARRFYNGAVRDLNEGILRFPALLVARTAGFREAEFFTADAAAHAVPAIEVTP